jgi:hypothetical protein
MPVRFDRATTPARGPQPGTVALKDYILGRWPMFHSLGIYNNRPVRGSTSLSVHAEGRAFDCGVGPGEGLWGSELAEWCVQNSPFLQIQQVIWNGRIWTSYVDSQGWRRYTGSAGPHTDHVHIEQNRIGATELPWNLLQLREYFDHPAPVGPEVPPRMRLVYPQPVVDMKYGAGWLMQLLEDGAVWMWGVPGPPAGEPIGANGQPYFTGEGRLASALDVQTDVRGVPQAWRITDRTGSHYHYGPKPWEN